MTIRCAKCGSSKFDPEFNGCVLCGGSPARRDEEVHVNERTKAILLSNAGELKRYGVTVIRIRQTKKHAVDVANLAIGAVGLGLQFAEALTPGITRKIVQYLHHKLKIPRNEIILLRLNDPGKIDNALKPKPRARRKLSAPKNATISKKSSSPRGHA